MTGLRLLQVYEPPDGGVARHVGQLAAGLADRGHEVHVAGPAGGLAVAGVAEAAYHEMPFVRSYRNPAADVAVLRELRRLARAQQPQIVHVHSAKAGVLGRIVARASGVPVVYTPHCYPFIGNVPRTRELFAQAVERGLGRITSQTICVSGAERAEALRRSIAPAECLPVVYNGTGPCEAGGADPELLAFREGGVLVGTVAVHRRQKGIDRLLRAAGEVLRRRPDVRVAIVGEGPLAAEHRRQAQLLGLGPRVGFFGFEHRSERYLRALDVFVLPSRYEAFPIAVLEAMACGAAVVATDVGGTREALDDAGVLVPDGDQAALVQAIVALAGAEETRVDLGRRAMRRVSQHFTLARMVDGTEAVYRTVLERPARPARAQP